MPNTPEEIRYVCPRHNCFVTPNGCGHCGKDVCGCFPSKEGKE